MSDSAAGADPPTASRGRLSTLLRRLFYPEQLQKEQLLLDLFEDLACYPDVPELCKAVGAGLHATLLPSALHIFTRHGQTLCLRWSSQADLQATIPTDFRLIQLAESWQELQDVDAISSLPEQELEWLQNLDAHRALPLADPDIKRLWGLILIGSQADEPAKGQRRLLTALGRRMAYHHRLLTEKLEQRLRGEQGQGRWLKECSQCGRCFGHNVMFCPDDDSITEPTILTEPLVDGRYLLRRKLGRGAGGAVYQADDLESGSEVALKILAGGDSVALKRFANEARAARTIDHPSITRVLGSGSMGRQGAYLVMEYVAGRTLRQLLDSEAPIAPPRLARWLDPILQGIHLAHSQGVIHRDLKPDNIMILPDGGAKLLDFGLAKLHNGSYQTAAGMVIGTLSYMSPEQMAAGKIDHRTDQFALAAITAEALTGRLPFHADNLGQMLHAVANEPFRIEVRTGAQATVADVLGRALAKSPDQRFEHVEAFRRSLIPALHDCEPFSQEPR